MKKYLIFIMGFILGIVGTSYAAYKLTAKEVSFDKSKTDLNGENVQDSIDEITDLIKYGDAEAGDIASGKTALVKGKKITGNSSLLNILEQGTIDTGMIDAATAVPLNIIFKNNYTSDDNARLVIYGIVGSAGVPACYVDSMSSAKVVGNSHSFYVFNGSGKGNANGGKGSCLLYYYVLKSKQWVF